MDGNGEQIRRWRQADVSLLQQVSLLAAMSEERLEALVKFASWRLYLPREAMPEWGGRQDHVFVLEEGRARVHVVTQVGGEISVLFLASGAIIDLSDLPAELRDALRIDATEQALVLRLPRQPFYEAVFSTPRAAAQLYTQTRRRLMEWALLLWELASHDAPTRLQHELARLAEEDPGHIVWATHEELGQRIGASREVVTRLLRQLRQRGLITYEPHHRGIKVLDVQRLAEAGIETG